MAPQAAPPTGAATTPTGARPRRSAMNADKFPKQRFVLERNVATSSTDNGLTPSAEAARRHPTLFRAVRRRQNPPLRRSDITVTDERAVKRAVKAASLGNAMEWFDFGIYAYLAGTIGRVFFPSGSETAQLLSSFATFAVAFLVRPLGGMVFGPMGTRSAARRSSR